MFADFKLKFNLQFLPFEHFRYVYSSVLIQPLRSHRLDPARPMSMHGPLHGCSARPNLEAERIETPSVKWMSVISAYEVRFNSDDGRTS